MVLPLVRVIGPRVWGVDALIPPIFAAYRRILHPASREGFFSGMGLAKLERARLSPYGRRYLVLRGRIQDMTVPLDPLASVTANMAWPDAREWFVHADLDFPCTYVCGSRSCIAELIAHPDLETLAAHPDDPIDYLSDQVNPLPVNRA